MTVDVIQRGEALAVLEGCAKRDLIIHFQQISRAAALYDNWLRALFRPRN